MSEKHNRGSAVLAFILRVIKETLHLISRKTGVRKTGAVFVQRGPECKTLVYKACLM